MTKILSELLKDDSVLLEIDKLDDFWKFCKTQDNLYAFRYLYFEKHVEITITKETIIRVKMKQKS
jgi:hypothetical protein